MAFLHRHGALRWDILGERARRIVHFSLCGRWAEIGKAASMSPSHRESVHLIVSPLFVELNVPFLMVPWLPHYSFPLIATGAYF